MPDVSLIADHAASPSNIQHRRDRMRLLSPTPDDALWLPAVGQAQDFWRTLCIRYLNQQNPAYSQAEQCLANLADAVQKSTQPTRGQPSLTRKTSKNLALLPVFNRSLTHEQWAMLAFAQALRALLEQPSLDTRGKKSRSLEGEFMLRNVFARAFEGFKAQLAAGFLPSGPSEPASDDDWAQAQHQANQWLQHPEFLNETGWHQPEYFVRTLVEFIVAYSGLFEEVESDEPDDDDEDDEIDEEQETDNEGLLKNSDETTQDATGKKQPSDVATKTIRLSTQGRALLHGGIAAPRAMPDNHPMLVPPQPWRYSQRGGRLVGAAHLCKSKALNAPAADMLQLIERSDMPIVFQALNQLQNTAWRINQQVLRTSQAIYYGDVEKNGFSPAIVELRNKAEEKPRTAKGHWPARAGSNEWLQKTRLARNTSHWHSGLGDLEGRSAFYYPYQLDYRGRIYPQAGWLSPQGDDLAKGLLEFANGKPIPHEDTEARRFLAIYGAQLAANTGIKTPTLDAYAQWSCDHSQDIMASAADPLRNTWWLEHSKSGTRWQMLAFCCAWSDMQQGKPVHLPVQVDGSCNGLQHMAALLRDKEMAQYTNLLLGSGEKQDLYTWILQGVRQNMECIEQDDTREDQPLAAWICAYGQNALSRDIAKKVVITFSYGSTNYKKKIYEYLQEVDTDPIGTTLSATNWLVAIEKSKKKGYKFPNATGIYGWDKEKSESKTKEADGKKLSSQELQECFAGSEAQQPLPAELQQKIQHFMRDRLASFLADCFKKVMEERLKNAVTLQSTLQKWSVDVAKKTGLPPVWVTPVGYPVMQLKKYKGKGKVKRTILDLTAFGELCKNLPDNMPIFIDLKGKDGRRQIPREQLPFFLGSPETQKTAFPPNFIHSLDAAHLMLTLNRCRQLGIEDFVAVHDSFGTHACDVAKLGRALRDSFMHLHRRPLLAQYHAWLQHLCDFASQPESPPPWQQTDYSDIQAAVLGLTRHYWLAVREKQPDSACASKLESPPDLLPQDKFDVDAIGKSSYIFF